MSRNLCQIISKYLVINMFYILAILDFFFFNNLVYRFFCSNICKIIRCFNMTLSHLAPLHLWIIVK